MKQYVPVFLLVVLHLPPAFAAETVTLAPAALKAVAIAGNAGAPTFTAQNVGVSYEVRARDFASGAVRGNVVYQRFDISTLAGGYVQSASLNFNRVAGDTLTTGRFALFGLAERASNLPQDWTPESFVYGTELDPTMFFDALASTDACPVQPANVVDFSSLEVVSGNRASLSSNAFVSFLQERLDNGGQATLLLTMPSQGAGNDKKMTFAFTGYVDPSLSVSLDITYDLVILPSPPDGVSLGEIEFSRTPTLWLGWEPVDGALAYNVYRRAVGEETATLVATTVDAGYYDEDIALFGTYFYSVDVVTEAGQSVPSTELEVHVIDARLGAPLAPASMGVSSSSPNTIGLEWSPVPNALYYEIYRSTESDRDFALLVTTDTASALDEQNVLGYRSYYYRIKTVSAGGISRPSETLTVKPRFVHGAHPSTPRKLSVAERTTSTVQLSWEESRNAQAYYVYRATSEAGLDDGNVTLVGITETTSFTDTFAVYPEQDYSYRIRAVNAAGFSRESRDLTVAALLHNSKQVEGLDRAPVAVPTIEGVRISWRLLGTDPEGIGFHIYRDGKRLNHAPIIGATNFLDRQGSIDSTYEVRPSFGLFERSPRESARSLGLGYLPIAIQPPPDGTSPDGSSFNYAANDASAADLDGDGSYEVILKWEPSNAQDNSKDGYTGSTMLDAYKLDGTLLWRIDLGSNLRSGAHYNPFLAYDFDGDGRAEIVVRTADGSVDGSGSTIGNTEVDYRNATGRVLDGPEYLTLFDGESGVELDTIDYVVPRGVVADWGDSYGNRVDRFNAGVAYLDGVHPSAYFARGYYGGQAGSGPGITAVAAFGVEEGRLVERWVFDTRVAGSQYIGQGNHQVTAGDVDRDGRDEVVLGSLVLDDNGVVLYSTNLGHGDAMHLGDLNPTRPGLELFSVKEETNRPFQTVLSDAATGQLLWGVFNGADTGRGLAADIDPNYAGTELWGAANSRVWSVSGEEIGQKRPSINFAIYWDGDPLRELFDGTSIRKWDYAGQKEVVLLDAIGASANNGTKATPCLQADLLGDWREEVVLRSADNSELRIYTTNTATELRLPTLMHDPQYRTAVAAQNTGYNQPPHPSYFIGNNMPQVGQPKVYVRPVPELLGFGRRQHAFDTAVLVTLAVNQGVSLVNEYRLDGGAWHTYGGPFVVARPGHHSLTFRTLDSEGNRLSESNQSFEIEAHWRHASKLDEWVSK